jgi:hypothetical protein
VKRIDYWKAQLKAAQTEERQVTRQYNQMARAFVRACDRVEELEKKVEHEKTKLAQSK